jgi:hypothetical protein
MMIGKGSERKSYEEWEEKVSGMIIRSREEGGTG